MPIRRTPDKPFLQRRAAPILLLLTFALALAGCRGTLSIGELLDDPNYYADRTVRIEGEVTETIGALGWGAYRVSDGTGTIVVVSEERGAPREGARVRVDGRFQPAFTLGPESVAALVERRRHLRSR